MKKFLLLLFAVGTVSTAGAQNGAETILKPGDAVPDFTIQMLDGPAVKMSDLKGKVVLLNFWATWCPPCRAKLTVIQAGLLDKIDNEDFIFIAVSRGETPNMVERFREQNGYTFPIAVDPETEIFPLFAETGIPRHYLIDRNGIVVEYGIGFDNDEAQPFDELIGKIEELLKNK